MANSLIPMLRLLLVLLMRLAAWSPRASSVVDAEQQHPGGSSFGSNSTTITTTTTTTTTAAAAAHGLLVGWDVAAYDRGALAVFRSELRRHACASHLMSGALEALGPTQAVAPGGTDSYLDGYYWAYNNNNNLHLVPLTACDLNLLAPNGTSSNGGLSGKDSTTTATTTATAATAAAATTAAVATAWSGNSSTSGDSYLIPRVSVTTLPCQMPGARQGIVGHLRANRGLANQLEFANGHLARAKSRRWRVQPPVFHMDGYHLPRDFTLPFRFLFDQDAFEQIAAKHGLLLPDRAWSAATTTAKTAATTDGSSSCSAKRVNRKQMWNTERKVRDMSTFSKTLFLDSVKEAEKRPGYLFSISPFLSSALFSRHILAAADPIVDHLRENGGFVGIHFRVELAADAAPRETWARHYGGLFGTVRQNVRAICAAIKHSEHTEHTEPMPLKKGEGVEGAHYGSSRHDPPPPKFAYVATYLGRGHPALAALRKCVEGELGLRVVTKFDFGSAWEEAQKTSQQQTASSQPTSDPFMTRNVLGLLEMAVLEQASFFVGHGVSSFSGAIGERREDLQLGPSKLLFMDVIKDAFAAIANVSAVSATAAAKSAVPVRTFRQIMREMSKRNG